MVRPAPREEGNRFQDLAGHNVDEHSNVLPHLHGVLNEGANMGGELP